MKPLVIALLLLRAIAFGGELSPYIEPRQQTDVTFGSFGFWHQPWRAYLDTWPLSRLLDGAGVVFNVPPDQAEAAATALAAHGFKHARIEVGWGAFRYDDPSRLVDEEGFQKMLRAVQAHGIRPLLLLNGNEGAPCPSRPLATKVLDDAPAGARTVKLEPGVAGIEPGRTGFDDVTHYLAGEVLISGYDAKTGVATLARPLPAPIPKGSCRLGVLRFAPFGPLRRGDGSPDPDTEATMRGWLDYVRAVAGHARAALGTGKAADAGFDVEIWNELTFGSAFLDARNYYDPKPDGSDDTERGWWPIEEIAARTAKLVKDPANQLPGVHVGNGFDSQRPWGAGSAEPPGIDAICKHPYPPRKRYPQDVPEQQPINALGQPDGERGKPALAPQMTVLFPEYGLTALQTEHLIRDVSPITTDIYRTAHGRPTHPAGGAPLTMWVTEINVSPDDANPGISADRAMQVKAKVALRLFTGMNHKGIARVYLFAAKEQDVGLGVLAEKFFVRGGAKTTSSPVLDAVGRLMAWSRTGGGPSGPPRALTVQKVVEPEERAVFQGDGTPAHPTLWNRDIFAFLPYQVNAQTFVVPYYVMTRDVFLDMPDETFEVVVGGLGSERVRVEAYDPLTDRTVPSRVVAVDGGTATIAVSATDSPRLLRIVEEGTATTTSTTVPRRKKKQ